MNAIGKNIKRLRKEENLSQEQLAERLHVTRQAVSSWETGKNQPDIETLESIAAVFGTDILAVLYGRLKQEESEEQKRLQRRHLIRNSLIWGIIAFAGLVIHLVIKDKIEGWYYRYMYTALVYFYVLFVRPLCIFAAAAAFMNGLSLIGDLKIRRTGIRKTILGVSTAFLIVYVSAAVLWMVPTVFPEAGPVLASTQTGAFVFRFVLTMITAPALFLLPGIGVFLGLKR